MLTEEALYSILIADAGVSAIAETRVVPGFLEQTTTQAAIAFRLISRDSETTLGYAERGHAQLAFSRYRFFSVTKGRGQYSTAKRLDEALRLALHGYAGVVTNNASPPESVTIQGIFSENSFDAYDDDTETNQVVRDFGVWASEIRPDPL